MDMFVYRFFGAIDNCFDWISNKSGKSKKVMSNKKILESFKNDADKKRKEMNIFKNLKQEVNHGANGTQQYVIKKGINKGKIAK